jgi:hypothetical protein
MSSGSETSGLAVTALILGILGFVCFPGVAGIAAIAFGIAARSDIAQSEGRRAGMGLANAGIATGATSVALTVVAFAAVITLIARPRPHPPHAIAPPATGTISGSAAPAVSSRHDPGSEFHRGTRPTRLGTLYLVDLGPDAASLEDALDAQRARAEQEERKLLLWLSRNDCQPCSGVAAALLDERLQRALADTWVVRVDVGDYQGDLEHLGIPTQFVPGFALLDTNNRPVDYLHGGEWDDDIPENIAPVLDRFVHGTYAKRRHPWQRWPDANATPI